MLTMKINTKPIDKQIRLMNQIISDEKNEARIRLMAVAKKTRLLQEKAELIESTVDNLDEINLGHSRIGNLYI